jgi:hypothetical protein
MHLSRLLFRTPRQRIDPWPVDHLSRFHPWHDIPTDPKPPAEITAVIEIPTNESNKYELDKQLGIVRAGPDIA